MVLRNNITNNQYFKRKHTVKVTEDPNYEYWRSVERSERLGKQFEKEHNMCCFTIVMGLMSIIGCACLPCSICYPKTYPEKN